MKQSLIHYTANTEKNKNSEKKKDTKKTRKRLYKGKTMGYIKKIGGNAAIFFITQKEADFLGIREDEDGNLVPMNAVETENTFDEVAIKLGFEGFSYDVTHMTDKAREKAVRENVMDENTSKTIAYQIIIITKKPLSPEERLLQRIMSEEDEEQENLPEESATVTKKWKKRNDRRFRNRSK